MAMSIDAMNPFMNNST
jgi:hypothetical protein